MSISTNGKRIFSVRHEEMLFNSRGRGSGKLRLGRGALLLFLALCSAPVAAKDRLGIYQNWAAFKDADTPRCYAIASPIERISGSTRPGYFSIGFWPDKNVDHQIYVNLSRDRSSNSAISVSVGGRRFRLKSAQTGGWAADRRMDLAIIAAIRSSASLSVESIGRDGRAIIDAYSMRGAPSAIDAAALGCVKG